MEHNEFYEVDGCMDFIPVTINETYADSIAVTVDNYMQGYNLVAKNAYRFPKIDEQQKVVVPKFVAEWIEKHRTEKNKDRLSYALGGVFEDVGVGLYIKQQEDDYTETIAKARLDGCEVEPEKQWVVKDDTGYLSYLQFSTHNICECETSLDKNDAYKFKSKSKADLFANLVAGTVEEVTDGTE